MNNKIRARDKHPLLAKSALVVSLLVCLFLAAVQTAVETDINDEHMYLAAAKLLDHHDIYRDFAFVQTPYMVYVYRWAMHLFPETELLLVARGVKLILVALTLLLFSLLLYRFSGSYWHATLLLLIFFSSAIFRSDLHMARNYQLPLLLTLLALYCLDLYYSAGRSRVILLFVSGLCLGLAVGTKLTYLLTGLAVALVQPWFNRGAMARLKSVCWTALGALTALLPLIWISALAGADTMIFNLFDYHRLNSVWRSAQAFDQGMDALGKLLLGLAQLLEISNIGVLILLFLLILLAIRGPGRRFGRPGLRIWILLGLIVSSLLFYLLPSPAWIWYLTPLWLFLSLLNADLLQRFGSPGEKRALLYLMLLLVVLSALVNMAGETLNIKRVCKAEEWRSHILDRNAEKLKSAVLQTGLKGKVATLRPLYALEAGLEIYPELASADFAYRVGSFLSEEERRRYHIVSLDSLDALLKHSPPVALVLGFDEELEQPFLQYAQVNGYTLHRDLIPGARVYVKSGKR